MEEEDQLISETLSPKDKIKHRAYLQNTGKLNTPPDIKYNKLKLSKGQYLQNTSIGKSKYDEGLTFAELDQSNIKESVDEHRAQNQGWATKASAGIARAGTKAAIEIAKLAPTVAGIVASPFAEDGQGWETAFNNAGHKALNALNETVNEELLPVYVKKAVRDGNLLTNLTSIDFWATEGADGVGFMAAMFAPGAILKAVGGANKFKAIMGGFEKGRELMQSAANLGLKADEIGITMFNTLAEAGAESGSQMEAMNKSKPEYIKNFISQGNTPEKAEQMFNEQKARVGRDSFVLNMALLSGTNFVNTKMLGLAGDQATNKAGNFALRNAEGNIIESVATRGLLDRFKDAPKNFGKMLLNEGFVEEGTQSTIEGYLSKEAKQGKLSDSLYDDISISGLATEYADMLTTTEGQKAIALGGILGYGSVAIRSAHQLATGKGTDADQEITRVNDLLAKGKAASNAYFARVNPDIYKRTEEIDPETGENGYVLVNGKKVIDPVLREQFLVNAQLTEEQGKLWDYAEQTGNEQLRESLQNVAEARFIESFIGDSSDGMNILKEHLKDNDNIPEERKKSIIKKAEALQKSNEQFLSYSQPVLNLKNEDATELDRQMTFKRLSDINKKNTLDKLYSEERLEAANKEIKELLSQHGLDESVKENNPLYQQLVQRDIRFEKPLKDESYHRSELDRIKESNLDDKFE